MRQKKIILVTGGQRSGKSEFSEKLALEHSDTPVYLATARVADDEFRERVRKHKARRGPNWSTIEEEIFLSRHDLSQKTVLIDCVTMWVTNVFFASGEDVTASRRFTDLQGWFNQYIAAHADEVYLTVSGIPLKIK